jgi:hypothetical protein
MKITRKCKVSIITGRTINLFISLALVLVISSCATGNSALISMDDIPSLSENKSRIYFYRTSLIFGSGMRPNIFLNGKKVGVSSSGTAFYVDIDPGKYKVSVDTILYPGGEGGLDFEVHGNEVVYVRTWTGASSFAGRTNAEVISPETAEKDIKGLKFLRFDIED